MSGEQHVPTGWGRALIQRCQVAEAVISRAAELGRAEAPRFEMLKVLGNPLPPHPGPVPEVRARPDRETIARKLDPAAWDPASRFTVAERAIRQETSLGKADAVLALFGKEGQATDEMSPRDLDHWRKGHDVGYAHGTTDAQLQAYEERQR